MAKQRTLYEYDAAEQAALPYAELCALRQEEYVRRISAMDIPDHLTEWAGRMVKSFGPRVFVHRIEILDGRPLDPWLFAFDWLTALMIVRYGQEASKWPAAFSAQDIGRALEWERGVRSGPGAPFRAPLGVSYPMEGEL